jgi:hypothetical protein
MQVEEVHFLTDLNQEKAKESAINDEYNMGYKFLDNKPLSVEREMVLQVYALNSMSSKLPGPK